MRLLSWNVNGRTGEPLDAQVAAVASAEPDLVALQEVTRESAPAWRERLAALGLRNWADSVALMHPPERRYANLLASRWPLAVMPAAEFEVPFPEKVLSAVVGAPFWAVEIHVAHLRPGVTWPEQKMLTNEGIYHRLARPALRPRVLCGDFNAPKSESADGQLETWATGGRGERWDMAERSVLQGLAEFDLVDVYRDCHGYGVEAKTWIPRSGGGVRRYDHLFASEKLRPWTCDYKHDWRETGLSDHSALVATLADGPAPIERKPARQQAPRADA